MLGLAIDSANRTASAALWSSIDPRADADCRSLTVLASGALASKTGKADQLIVVIEQLLGERRLSYSDLDVIAVNRGPGSFTGIRSAVALARGLALAAGLPLLGVTSHEATAASLGQGHARGKIMIVLDARRGEVYAQAFAADGYPLGDIEAKAPALVAAALSKGRWRLAGSGAALVSAALTDGQNVEIIETPPVDAGMVTLAAAARLSAGEKPVPGFALQPLYVRAPDAVPPTPLMSKTTVSAVRA